MANFTKYTAVKLTGKYQDMIEKKGISPNTIQDKAEYLGIYVPEDSKLRTTVKAAMDKSVTPIIFKTVSAACKSEASKIAKLGGNVAELEQALIRSIELAVDKFVSTLLGRGLQSYAIRELRGIPHPPQPETGKVEQDTSLDM